MLLTIMMITITITAITITMTITITLTIDEDNNNLIIVLSELFATVQNSKLEVFGARLVDSMPLILLHEFI